MQTPRSRRLAGLILGTLAGLSALHGAPALTTIQDTLYKADGTRFNGMVMIEWSSFETLDASNIAGHSLTVPISDGVLRVRLAPTTTATPASYYTVRYNSGGKAQFTETWLVPPSTTPLRVKAVRVAAPASPQVGNVTSTVAIGDVTGLADELALRPVKGPGYAPSRAAIIGAAGELAAAEGDLSDCMRVDGTSGPCGTVGGNAAATPPVFTDAETPAGLVDGSNRVFGLAGAPSPAASLSLFRNGVLQAAGLDYALSGASVTLSAGAAPQPGDVLLAYYRLDGSSAGFFENETPGGLVNGTNATFALSSSPSPAASLSLYRNGLLQKPGTDYTASGNTITFVPAATPQSGDVLRASFRTSVTSPGFADGEIPAGAVNGTNVTFTLASAPNPPASLMLYRNGVLQKPGLDYTLDAGTVAFAAAPVTEDLLLASYRVPPAIAGTTPQVLCIGSGLGTSATVAAALAQCVIPSGTLKAGDRVEIRFDAAHTGSSAGFTFEAGWGATTLVSRSAAASESLLTGRGEVGIYGTAAQFSSQSWGAGTAFVAGVGTTSETGSGGLTVSFRGQMAVAGSDSLTLRHYLVLRYPAP